MRRLLFDARLRAIALHLHTRARYRCSVLRGKPIAHFIHVGKTGGIAIRATLRRHLDQGLYAIFLHGHGTTLRDVPMGEKVFFFLRHPLSKFVSGFCYRQRQARPQFDIPWRPQEALAFARFHTPNQLARALSAADAQQRAYALHAMRNIHQVRDSNYRWFCDRNYFLSRADDVLFIGLQEQLGQDFERLKGVLGLAREIRLPTPEMAAYQKTRGVDTTLDQVATANLMQWYRQDIAFYQLCCSLRQRE